MELVLKSAEVFKKSMEAIAVLIDEAELVVTQNGLELKATDPSQISMVDFSLPKAAFTKFSATDTRLGLDLDYLNQVLSRATSGDELVLSLDEKKAFLSVTFNGSAKRSFQVPLIDISSADVPNPRIEFDAELLVSAGFLQSAFKDAALISSHVTLGCTEEKFFVKGSAPVRVSYPIGEANISYFLAPRIESQ